MRKSKCSRLGLLFLYSLSIFLFVMVILAFVLLSYSLAGADPQDPLDAEADQPPVADPNMQSSFLLPSAYTLPKDEVSMDILGLHTLGVRWGVTDRVQLNAGFRLIGVYLGATTNIARWQKSAFSVEAGVGLPVTAFDGKYYAIWLVNPVYSVGGDDLTFTVGSVIGGAFERQGALAVPYVSVMKRVSRKAKLFLEVCDGIAIGGIFGENHNGANYIFTMPGLRLHGSRFSCDLALIVPVYYQGMEDHPFFVVPYPSFSIRF